jgi:hypothetical protein
VVGLLEDDNTFGIFFIWSPNRYAIETTPANGRFRGLSFSKAPVEARQEPNVQGNVFGCGILMDPDNKLTTFFTLNGVLLSKIFRRIMQIS